MLAASLRIMGASHVNMQPFKNPIRSTSIMSSMARKSSTDNTQQQQQNTTSSNPKLNNSNPVSNPQLQGQQQQNNPGANSNPGSNEKIPINSPTNSTLSHTHGHPEISLKSGLPITSNGGQRIITEQVESNSFTDHSKFFILYLIY